MAQEKKKSLNGQEPNTLPEAKIILAFLACRLDDLEKQLDVSRKETEDALRARGALADTLASYLKDQGAITEHFRQDMAVMRVKLEDREAELRSLRVQHSAFVEQILRDRERSAQAQTDLAQFALEGQELLRRRREQEVLAGTHQPPEGSRSSETPPEEPDFGGLLIDIRSSYDADLPPTVVQEDWIAGSPLRPNFMGTATEQQHLDGLPGSGGPSASRASDASGANGISGQVASDSSGMSPPSRDINWGDYTGLGFNSNLDRTVEPDNASEAPTEPFTTEETKHIYRRYYPHLLDQPGGNAAGEAQGNEVGKTSPPDEQLRTPEDFDDGGRNRKVVDQGEASGSGSSNDSGDLKGTTAGEAVKSRGIVYPTPGVLRTGLYPPGSVGGEAVSRNAQEAHSPSTQTYDHSTRPRPAPSPFEFGVQFEPPPSSQHRYRRTVHIGNLPAGVTLQALMESVRGGMILKATILNTVPFTGSPSALVTFLEPQAAADYAAFAGLYPIRILGSIVVVTLIPTPSFPISYQIGRAVRRYNQTRVLRLDGIHLSPAAMGRLLYDLGVERASRMGLIESIRRVNDLAVDLTFASVDLALRAYFAFLTDEAFHIPDARGTFLPDPCAQSLETLAWMHGCKDGQA
ncbi:hypothetical protein GP486_005267 [Trichoglossum hirsutum]|uniref:RRM domain-containing protein n=1 Tax=Trichoglossum hirsutum TaxID=265104 RepID=A0A9P8RN06_9PEZI|nr:hypothetical protein GP486_005267 [Trichoglossum hirsutum]